MAALGEDLLRVVNQLQDLVFNTIGTDSLDLPQIVCRLLPRASALFACSSLPFLCVPALCGYLQYLAHSFMYDLCG